MTLISPALALLIDLTHTLSPEIPTWEGTCGFTQTITVDYQTYPNASCRIQSLSLFAGLGTHIDAPAHFIKNGMTIEQIPLEKLCVPVCVIDVSAHADQNYCISAQDVLTYEQKHGPIMPNSFVIGYTGWERFWHTPAAYRNADAAGHMHFPGFSLEAAQLLLKRAIAGIGIDTLSPDGADLTFPVHKAILSAGCYIVENIAHAGRLAPTGAQVIIMPLKIQNGTESPARVIAIVDK
ncbi:cyclase family protein [Methylicorpusculum sp.]|uniref:cyclase family protein n=1 Tax=Methylicorpusculum sp. TaxID=2713644 RepID=UPI002ABA98E9|nr:cyclase family protein [Methylicorpusculum sp.]MDZ4154207.1 cyclase family protein [Methylicorpusculum sp.]